MQFRHYVYIWTIITAAVAFEYWALNFHPHLSLLTQLQARAPALQHLNLTTEAGAPLSFWLGCIGLGLILTTNFYVLRKKVSSLHGLGTLAGWLDFHIFCGLLGPTLIVFHSDFKVRGLVAISFWSMIIVAVSGIAGRYIYLQVLKAEKGLSTQSGLWSDRLEKLRATARVAIAVAEMEKLKLRALHFVGVPMSRDLARHSTFEILAGAVIGDLRMLISAPQTAPGLPQKSRYALAEYALTQRRLILLEPFRKMLGYWHAFHLPFAFFMYIAAVIHVAAVWIFGRLHS